MQIIGIVEGLNYSKVDLTIICDIQNDRMVYVSGYVRYVSGRIRPFRLTKDGVINLSQDEGVANLIGKKSLNIKAV